MENSDSTVEHCDCTMCHVIPQREDCETVEEHVCTTVEHWDSTVEHIDSTFEQFETTVENVTP